MKRVLVKKARKAYVEDLDRDVIVDKSAVYFVEDSSKDFSTKDGTIKKEDLQKTSGQVASSTGKTFSIFPQSFIDEYRGTKKLAQTISRKDIGFIITETGLGKDSIVGEAGTGSAGLSCYLAPLVKKIHSFDSNAKHLETAKKNIARLRLENIEIREQDVYKDIPCAGCDVFILDLPEPWRAIEHAMKAVKVGGFIINYSPQILQVERLMEKAETMDALLVIKTVELIERPWKVKKNIARPASQMLNHTAFLTVLRKIQ